MSPTTKTPAIARRLALPAALAALAAGCISTDDAPPAQCETTDDCNAAAGEICAEGVCYGDPPDHAVFAAVLVPPDARGDLAITELPGLSIAPDGTIAGLDFADSILVEGRVLLACPTDVTEVPCGEGASIAAQITVERAASFAGGPAWRRQVVATAGVAPGTAAFSVRLPRDGATYQVTIVPESPDTSAAGTAARSPAELAPPRQLAITSTEDQLVEWYLGEPSELKRVLGCVQNQLGNGAPYAGMRVTAFGRWSELGRLERASSLATTNADGCFDLVVPRKMLDQFDVLVRPAPDSALPTLRLFGELVPDPLDGEVGDHQIDPPLLMPNTPTPVGFRLPVRAPGSGGGQVPVAGADVRVSTVFTMPVQPEAPDRVVEVRHDAQAVTSGLETSEPGVADLLLYPGENGQNRAYVVNVVPPAGAEFAAAWNASLSVGTAGGLLEGLLLGRRLGLAGSIVSAEGLAIEEAPVEVKLSSLFRWNVGDEAIAQAAEALPLGTATTGEDGSFFLWLDRELLDAPAYYDLEIKPPTHAGPRWTFDGIAPSPADALDVGQLTLPRAAYARGPIRDPAGAPVAGAELRLYQLPDEGLCASAPLEPSECNPPAVLRGSFVSDEAGVVRPVLPDP